MLENKVVVTGAGGGTAVASTDSVADWESANRIVKGAIDAYQKIDVRLNGTFNVSRAAAP